MSKLDSRRLSSFYLEKRSSYDPLQQRLAHEHVQVDNLCAEHDDISYKLLDPHRLPPFEYRVTFQNLKSIIGIDDRQFPVYGHTHVLELKLTPGFPLTPPVCYMCTPTWHPNIQSEAGPFQGRICGNTEAFGAFYSLDELILRVRSMLAYENYHATMTDPFPEDEDVARWVREIGEPLGMFKMELGLTPDWTPPENWQSLIVPEKKIRISMV